jgi:hypothetical protein
VAVISAAIADPIVEFASNAGWFGAGRFTDHSNLDVVPALIAGVGLLVLYLVRKARAIVLERSSLGLGALLPLIFTLQILTLYAMETAEQLVVWRHVLGPTVWLGAPAPISIAIHATICCGVVLAILRSRRALATTTLRVIRIIQAIATLGIAREKPPATRGIWQICFKELIPVLGAVCERAPPLAIV